MTVRAVSIVVPSQILKLVLSLVLQILIARLLLPEGRGIYAICLAITSVLMVATFLGNEYGIRYLLVHRKITSAQAFWYLLTTAILSLTVSLGAIWATSFFDFWLSDLVTQLQLSLASLLAITQLITTQMNVFMTIKGQYLKASAFAVGEELTKLILMSVLLTSYPSVEVALFSVALGNILISIAVLLRNRYYALESQRIHIKDLTFIYGYGARSVWLNLSNLSVTQLGTLVLSSLMSAERIAIYNLAFGLIARVQVIPDALNRILVPASVANNDRPKQLKLIKISVTGLLVFSLLVVPVLALFSKPIFVLMFGNEYADAGPIAFILFIGFSFKIIGKPIEAHFNEIVGEPTIIAVIQVFSVVVMACLSYFGAVNFGLTGAAIGSSLALAVSATTLFAAYTSKTQQKFSEMFDFAAFRDSLPKKR